MKGKDQSQPHPAYARSPPARPSWGSATAQQVRPARTRTAGKLIGTDPQPHGVAFAFLNGMAFLKL